MITRTDDNDFDTIYEIINDASSAYRGIIPTDRWHEPYMPKADLAKQIEEGVQFWKYSEDDKILGVMGIQIKADITLIRHAYVRTVVRGKGIGSKLLEHLCRYASTPILIGTWAEANWAIEFYRKHGFRLLPKEVAYSLLQKYWSVPVRQMETSVVLASENWLSEM